MMRRSNFARRARRKGLGVLPPNPKQWDNEHNGLDIREDMGLSVDDPLHCVDAVALLPDAVVMSHGEIPAAACHLETLRADRGRAWSGLAITLPDGLHLIIYNDAHSPARIAVTVMEEFFHIWLGHPPTRVRNLDGAGSLRSYDKSVEDQAFGSAAAALIPYSALKERTRSGVSAKLIADEYGISEELVRFRQKVTRLLVRSRRK